MSTLFYCLVVLWAALWLVEIRNEKVHAFSIQILNESEYINQRFYPYALLPTYNQMMFRVWIWDFNKFLPPSPH